jgi:TonB family protein
MKNKSYSVQIKFKVLILLVTILAFSTAFTTNASAQTSGDSGVTPYVAVEEMPSFPGGNPALTKYINEHLHYPSGAQERGVQGKVIVKFCVTATGGVDLLSILKSVDPDLDREAMRVIKTITKFNPGKKGGTPVPVWYLVPITFSIKEGN